jgi:hypothetical protein
MTGEALLFAWFPPSLCSQRFRLVHLDTFFCDATKAAVRVFLCIYVMPVYCSHLARVPRKEDLVTLQRYDTVTHTHTRCAVCLLRLIFSVLRF